MRVIRMALGFLMLSFFTQAAAAQAPETGLNADWQVGLSGLNSVQFSEKALGLLGKNGFVIQPTHMADVADIYAAARHLGQGQFVTTDAMLHTGHIFFDYLLRLLEIDKLYGMAEKLTDRMLALSTAQYQEILDPQLKEAPRFVTTAHAQFGVRCAYADPARLGVDRWVAVLAAYHAAHGAACVLDAGTAVTFDAVAADGRHLGGLIFPGARQMPVR